MRFEDLNPLHVTCSPGLAPFLQEEIEALGLAVGSSHATGVELTATFRDAMRLNLHLRTAQHVLWQLDAFRCPNPDVLYERVSAIAWEDLISPDEYLSVVSRVDTPTIDNTMYASLKVKDAIVDRVAEAVGRRPDAGADRDCVVVSLYWKGDRAVISLDTSGRKLSDRGYRKMPWKAPMQETLAAGVLLAAGYDGSAPLVVPMCGSGTLAIEGALIATGRAPGLLRSNYSMMHVEGFPAKAWSDLRLAAKKASRGRGAGPIIATDIAADAVEAARRNARTAGVEQLIEFRVCDFAETPVPRGEGEAEGVVVFNPEYGQRLGETDRLAETYGRIGDFLKQSCPGYRGYVFTGNRELSKRVGLRASRRVPMFNAGIECRLLEYRMYAGRGAASE